MQHKLAANQLPNPAPTPLLKLQPNPMDHILEPVSVATVENVSIISPQAVVVYAELVWVESAREQNPKYVTGIAND